MQTKYQRDLEWLSSNGIENAVLNKRTGRWDVIGDVDLENRDVEYDWEDLGLVYKSKGLNKFPLKFGVVTGNFYCSLNLLESLDGAPTYVGENFIAEYCGLKSLIDCPQHVGKDFSCFGNGLSTLSGGPEFVGGDYICEANQLTSFDCTGVIVIGNFLGKTNPIETLQLMPQWVEKDFCFDKNNLTTLDFAQSVINGEICMRTGRKNDERNFKFYRSVRKHGQNFAGVNFGDPF